MAVVIGPAINLASDYTDFGIPDHWIDDATVTPANYPYGTNYSTYFYDIVNKLAEDLNTTVAGFQTMNPDNSVPYTTTYGNNTYYIYISSDYRDNDFEHRSGIYFVPTG
jgi:hypothetical protein